MRTTRVSRVNCTVDVILPVLYWAYTLYMHVLATGKYISCKLHFVFPVRDKVPLRLLCILGKVLYYVRAERLIKYMKSLVTLYVC